MAMLLQPPLPETFRKASVAELDGRIAAARATLGRRLVILGHHYQRDAVIKFADFIGDSFKLAQQAALRPEADFIVFCGVHFMAESAEVLSAPHQRVVLPDLSAGCSMADMANIDQVEECWEGLSEIVDETIVPITYMNSAANLKAFVGRNGGAVCTSTNAPQVMQWSFERGPKLLFFPDQHLGRNTAVKLGLALDDCAVWDPAKELGGLNAETIRRAKVLLWKGHCSVHQLFVVPQVQRVREEHPDINVIVHPECRYEVVQLADYAGSTEYIVRTINAAPPGTKWAVGTEVNLTHRLAHQNPDKLVISLDENVCVCSTMYRIDPPHLCWALEQLVAGEVVNHIVVPEDIAGWARISLDRMLSIN